ncbi:MAG: cystathionine beta-lyase [Devosiaceae bacterium]|nr:cystathionine beta-lyase [Devosiaceae bacterium MH13]
MSKKTEVANRQLDTQLVHLGRNREDSAGFVNVPVNRGSTVLFPDVQSMEDPSSMRYTYGLQGSPLIEALQSTINTLEEAAGTVLVPSGLMAVTLPLLAVAQPGMRALIPDNVYWPTRRFCDGLFARLGIETVYYDPLIGAGIEALLLPDRKSILFTEAPGSNTFEMPDLPALLAAAKAADAWTMIDNTWATPLLYKPVPAGFDFSIQAGTKYFAGHSDALIGSVSASERAWKALSSTHQQLGLQAGTEEMFLALRGMRTLSVRLARHEASALDMAHWLCTQPFVKRVLHPGLPDDPGYALTQSLFGGRSSGLFAFVLDGNREQAREMLNTLELFGLGYSWGGYESLAVLAQLDHCRTVSRWSDGPVVRLSIGLEDTADLKADLLKGAAQAGLPTADG